MVPDIDHMSSVNHSAPSSPHHPHHPHPLEQVDPRGLYTEYEGHWKCDNCYQHFPPSEQPYHCAVPDCPFDLCHKCHQPYTHKRHANHRLYRTQMTKIYPQYDGRWKCDACRANKSPCDEPISYHCFVDSFDLCDECFDGRLVPIHEHSLKPADSMVVYGPSTGMWVCNVCKRQGNHPGMTQYSWHCDVQGCEFDTCDDCLKEVTFTEVHPHPMKRTDSKVAYAEYHGCWQCDVCNIDFTPTFGGPNEQYPYHCFTCEFDVCNGCLHMSHDGPSSLDLPLDEAGPPPRSRSPRPHSAPRTGFPNFHRQPTEYFTGLLDSAFQSRSSETQSLLVDDNEEDVGEDVADSERCVICMSRRKTATIVHSSTGHVCCCIRCAVRLKTENSPCPICRAPIEKVIKQFVT